MERKVNIKCISGQVDRVKVEQAIRKRLKQLDCTHIDGLMMMQQAFVFALHKLEQVGVLNDFLDAVENEAKEVKMNLMFSISVCQAIQDELGIKNPRQ